MTPVSWNDTIVAVSTGWQPARVGVVRMSGPEALTLVGELGAIAPTSGPASGSASGSKVGRGACWTSETLLWDADRRLPATILWFRSPHSYTGQDVVEIHTAGCLPLLRELAGRLIERGARRALPGEFTARAFMNGKLDAGQVEGVLASMSGTQAADVRHEARSTRLRRQQQFTEATARLMHLLALIEASIDFVDEEDVGAISAAEVTSALDSLLTDLAVLQSPDSSSIVADRPHVALAGLPNAGKSALFNALVGFERALVTPVPGTTRDVLSAELDLGGIGLVLQDCAGLGATADDMELAAHLAAERAGLEADLVLWVHAADQSWTPGEIAAGLRIPLDRRLLVISKTDLATPRPAPAQIPFDQSVTVSAVQHEGLERLRAAIVQRLAARPAPAAITPNEDFRAARSALLRARELAGGGATREIAGPHHGTESRQAVESPELVSLELRLAEGLLRRLEAQEPLDERLLDRIFSQFCVGK